MDVRRAGGPIYFVCSDLRRKEVTDDNLVVAIALICLCIIIVSLVVGIWVSNYIEQIKMMCAS